MSIIEQLTTVFLQIITLSNIVFCLFIGLVTKSQRMVVEHFWKNAGKNKLWNELVMPLIPLFLGGVFGYLFKGFLFEGSSSTQSIIWGFVLGAFSGTFYRIIKRLIKKEEKEILNTDAKEVEEDSKNKDIF